MKKALLILLLLGGCAHREPVVEVREVQVPVPTPVPVACVDKSDIPPEPKRVSDRFNGDARHDLLILAPSAQELRQWGQELRAMLQKCAEPE